MKRSTLLIPLVAVAALTLVSSTAAVAQQREHGRERGDRQSEGRAVERAQPRSEQPRAAQPQPQQRQEQRRAEPAAPRVEQRRPEAVAPRVEQRRPESVAPRVEQRRPESVAPRVEQRRPESRGEVAVPRAYAPRYEPRYEPRYSPRYSTPRYEPRYDSRWNGRYIVPRYYEPRWYQSRFYYRPYVFRPRFSIGFGIFGGYPVPYTYSYPSYAYSSPSYYGGVSLDIAPFNGEVYVDGAYMGIVEDFDGTYQALTLRAGRHRIEVRAPGYADLVFDVDVMPGQVIPYRGDLQPY